MSACKTCGRPAGLLSDQCRDCKDASRQRAQQAREAQQIQVAQQRRDLTEAKRSDYVAASRDAIAATLAAGSPAYLHDSVYLQVDSQVLDEEMGVWEMEELRSLGLQGWEIVGTVPRTIGTGLSNVTAGTRFPETSWGGGMGGNVAGVYVLLRYRITNDSANGSIGVVNDFLERAARMQFP